MNVETPFPIWLKQRRKALDLRQEDLAERIGCSESTIRKLELGVRRPSRQMAELLAEQLRIPPEERQAFINFARGQDSVSEQASPVAAAPTPLLHTSLTPLIGREKEVEEASSFLLHNGVRLLTLTGPPGVGKTSLALQVAAGLLPNFREGVFFVRLASIVEPSIVVSTIAKVLGLPESVSRTPTETLTESLRDKEMLLLLDNFEQVIEAAQAVVDILTTCPSVKVLVTSREPLHVRGERVFRVAPLQVPEASHPQTVDALSRTPAVALFIERAQSFEPDFSLNELNAEVVANICIRLEGLPLAIELAAARVKFLTLEAILTRLDSRLKLLTGGPRDLPAHQQTLRNTIRWSYELLDDEEKTLFRRLAVFRGGRTLQAIEAVCNVEGDASRGSVQALKLDVLDGISSLIDKSLLRQEEGVSREPRLVMLETIHEYAREKLEESGEGEELSREHALYFMGLAEEAELHLTGEEQAEWLQRLEEEYANIRAALRWAREIGTGNPHAAEAGLRLAGALWRFWYVRGYYREGREQLEELLALLLSLPLSLSTGYSVPDMSAVPSAAAARAKALYGAGNLARQQGDYEAARSLYEESLAISRELGDMRGIANVLDGLGIVANSQGEGDEAAARSLHEEGLAMRRELGNKRDIAVSLNNLANVVTTQGDYATARSLLEESLAVGRELGHKRLIAYVLNTLGLVAYMERDYEAARSLYEESVVMLRELSDKRGIAVSLVGLGGVAAGMGMEQVERGARLLGAATTLLKAVGAVLDQEDRIPYEHGILSARAQLDEEEFEKAWAEGQAMSMEQAIDYAVEARTPSSAAQ